MGSHLILFTLLAFVAGSCGWANQAEAAHNTTKPAPKNTPKNAMDELDPFSPDVEKQLEEFDRAYQRSTNKSSWLDGINPQLRSATGGCFRSQCKVFAYVRRSDQKLYLFVDGNPVHDWLVSTGAVGHGTPDFDRHPNGRVYDEYMSKTFPGGNYMGLGNMPYAVFIEGGFAIHGTAKSNWKRLGTRASHGCVRLHPDNALIFNRLVRQHGVENVWIQITE